MVMYNDLMTEKKTAWKRYRNEHSISQKEDFKTYRAWSRQHYRYTYEEREQMKKEYNTTP